MIMKRTLPAFCLFLALPFCAQAAMFGDDPRPTVSASGASFDTVFSPGEDADKVVVKSISSAQKSVRVAAQFFTSKPVAEALVAAKRSGKDVQIVLDKGNDHTGTSAAPFLLAMSQPPRMAVKYDHLYASYMIIDDSKIIVGKIAGIAAADEGQKNATALLIIAGAPDLAKRYLSNWQGLWDNSVEMKDDKKK